MSNDDFGKFSDDALVVAYAESVLTFHSIQHVGAANRYASRENRIFREIRARSPRLDLLRPLLDHPAPRVRLNAAIVFRTIDHAAFKRTVGQLAKSSDDIGRTAESVLRDDEHQQRVGYPENQPPSAPRKLPPQYEWQCGNPPPAAMPSDQIERRLRAELPEATDQLMALARPAIGLWPQRPRQDIPVGASRLGGMPYAPPDWSWPMFETEPLLFVGQINCAELSGLSGAEKLPSSGLLAFFGDHDAVMGCMMTAGGIAAYHWPDIAGLQAASPPIEPSIVFPVVELAFRPLIDLPDQYNRAVLEILRDHEQGDLYAKLHDEVRYHGIPDEVRFCCSLSKLFGWPKLVQGENLDTFNELDAHDTHLLMQVDGYSNGVEAHGWADAGSLYFLIRDRDLRQQRFDRCAFEIQFA